MQGAGCRVQGVGCRVQGVRCRVQGAGCSVWGLPAGGRLRRVVEAKHPVRERYLHTGVPFFALIGRNLLGHSNFWLELLINEIPHQTVLGGYRGTLLIRNSLLVQGYLAHKKQPPFTRVPR